MRMTIDEANRLLEELEIAKEIMQKYQKIKQIIEDRDAEIIPEDYDNWYINKIREVIKDGENK